MYSNRECLRMLKHCWVNSPVHRSAFPLHSPFSSHIIVTSVMSEVKFTNWYPTLHLYAKMSLAWKVVRMGVVINALSGTSSLLHVTSRKNKTIYSHILTIAANNVILLYTFLTHICLMIKGKQIQVATTQH